MVRLASIKNSKYSFYLSPIIHVIHVSPVPGCPGADGNSGEPDCQMLKSHVRGQLESDLCIIISCDTLCSVLHCAFIIIARNMFWTMSIKKLQVINSCQVFRLVGTVPIDTIV